MVSLGLSHYPPARLHDWYRIIIIWGKCKWIHVVYYDLIDIVIIWQVNTRSIFYDLIDIVVISVLDYRLVSSKSIFNII